jgi:hypothetical protein
MQHAKRASPTYECSISQSITSSARASTLGGTVRPSAKFDQIEYRRIQQGLVDSDTLSRMECPAKW